MKSNRLTLWKILTVTAMAALSVNVVVAEIQIVTDGLVSFWSLDKSSISGDTVRDQWGNNHGVMVDGPEIVEGKINEALLFDGQASLVEIDHSDSLDITEAITMEFWFLLDGNSAENEFPRPLSKGQSLVDNGSYGIWVNNSATTDIGFRSPTIAPTDIRSQALPDYRDDDWHHIVVTFDGEQGKLYLDGVNYVDIPVSGELASEEEPLHIGDGRDERHFSGAVDEARIYNRALSEDEVVQNFEATSNSVSVDPISKLAGLWGQIKVR